MALETLDSQIDIRNLSVETPEGKEFDLDKLLTPGIGKLMIESLRKFAAEANAEAFLGVSHNINILDRSQLKTVEQDNVMMAFLVRQIRKMQDEKNTECFRPLAFFRQTFPDYAKLVEIDEKLLGDFAQKIVSFTRRIEDMARQLWIVRVLKPNLIRPLVEIDDRKILIYKQVLMEETAARVQASVSPDQWTNSLMAWARFRMSFPEYFDPRDITPEAKKSMEANLVYLLDGFEDPGFVKNKEFEWFLADAAHYKLLMAKEFIYKDGVIKLTSPVSSAGFNQPVEQLPKGRKF